MQAPPLVCPPTEEEEQALAVGLRSADAFTLRRCQIVRATLARLGIRWRRAKDWITSLDPAYARKQTRATA